MKPTHTLAILLFSFLIGASCTTKEKPQIEGFNSDLWKKDKKGCDGKRSVMAEAIFANSTQFKGMDDDELADFLGKPEQSNWEDRGKKTYYYFIQPGSRCNSSLLLEGAKIAVEFDALGRVKLITEQKF